MKKLIATLIMVTLGFGLIAGADPVYTLTQLRHGIRKRQSRLPILLFSASSKDLMKKDSQRILNGNTWNSVL
ncbi:MAG: hypothetical protein K5787_15640 [Lentisphaeria bacterium]|nr:hypothetical protein [Lentisphaeria bacterium]